MAERDEAILANEDGTNHRIWLDTSPTPRGLGEGESDPAVVFLRRRVDHRIPDSTRGGGGLLGDFAGFGFAFGGGISSGAWKIMR